MLSETRGTELLRTVDGGLTAQLLKHFGGTSQPVTGFADGDVEDEFLDAELAHGVCALIFAGFRLWYNSSQRVELEE